MDRIIRVRAGRGERDSRGKDLPESGKDTQRAMLFFHSRSNATGPTLKKSAERLQVVASLLELSSNLREGGHLGNDLESAFDHIRIEYESG